jgi:hypothetical protein
MKPSFKNSNDEQPYGEHYLEVLICPHKTGGMSFDE